MCEFSTAAPWTSIATSSRWARVARCPVPLPKEKSQRKPCAASHAGDGRPRCVSPTSLLAILALLSQLDEPGRCETWRFGGEGVDLRLSLSKSLEDQVLLMAHFEQQTLDPREALVDRWRDDGDLHASGIAPTDALGRHNDERILDD